MAAPDRDPGGLAAGVPVEMRFQLLPVFIRVRGEVLLREALDLALDRDRGFTEDPVLAAVLADTESLAQDAVVDLGAKLEVR